MLGEYKKAILEAIEDHVTPEIYNGVEYKLEDIWGEVDRAKDLLNITSIQDLSNIEDAHYYLSELSDKLY